MKATQRIVSDPDILGGKLIIRGTRISVEFILELMTSGMTTTDITKEYTQLTSADIKAALQCAQRAISKEYIIPAGIAQPVRG